ncbi:hypothetical protein CVT25_010346 [Psilocybe cyanescens]|uniref:Phosphatidate phosphatase APP1 catalytic domain-containing protein n=1 Tax=Psilocybe cyanescens TaxID=93625 RepID=A0A409XNY1_PSICY|nr:hypothetical protein CVT25_010346 [Psilocybe cyanescens]
MQLGRLYFSIALIFSAVHGLPTLPASRGILDDVGILDDIFVFDAPAYPDPANPGNTLIDLQSFVSLRQIDLGGLTAALSAVLSTLGVNVGDQINNLRERIKLIGAIGLPGKSTTVTVVGCSSTAQTGETSGSDLGMSLNAGVSLGTCGAGKELESTAKLGGFFNGRTVKASVFSSPDSGFGVISDIDDTVKISNTLDKLALLKSTLLEEPKPVPGMPELYTSLSKSLYDPQFVYITASPFQIYPFLNEFLDTTYSTAKGPIFASNLTIVDPSEIIQFITSSNTEAFKLSSIDRVKGMYPNKKWLAIGDSTQKDPEVYAQSIRKYGDSIVCAWIRRVEGANNTDERFAAAFSGIPASRFRIYTDADIAGLASINVAGGEC